MRGLTRLFAAVPSLLASGTRPLVSTVYAHELLAANTVKPSMGQRRFTLKARQ